MPFVNIPGFEGKIYEPKKRPGRLRKHDCPDCYSCQMCGEERCQVCHPEDARNLTPTGPDKKHPEDA